MGMIYIVGLGPGDAGQITTETWDLLQGSMPVYLRTQIHPSVEEVRHRGINFTSFDTVYDELADFDAVYDTIVNTLIEYSRTGDIVYAVPGSPLVAERTVRMLWDAAEQKKVMINVKAGMSFLEVLYTRIGIDPVEGLFITDGEELENLSAVPDAAVIITQLYNRRVASDVKLSLMNFYEDEANIIVVHHLSLPDEQVRTIPLFELDRIEWIDHLTSLVIPKTAKRINSAIAPNITAFDIEPLEDVVSALRAPDGCPWDKIQTHLTLRKYLLEEAYEVLEAIDNRDTTNFCEELGDLLLQIVFHARLAEEEELFTMQDVIDGVTEKMVRRHPHVFGTLETADTNVIAENWETIKAKEKGHGDRKCVMDGISPELTTVLKTEKIQEKAAKVGFVWHKSEEIWGKVEEEIGELREAIEHKDRENAELEGGDVLFSLINLLGWYKISGENALRRTNYKFLQRFSYVEEQVRKSGESWEAFSLQELDQWWKDAKEVEKASQM